MAEYPDEWKWWTEWNAAFANDASNLKERVEVALAHLRAATEEEKQKGQGKPNPEAEGEESGQASDEMDEQSEREEQMGHSLDQAIKDFLDRMQIDEFCAHDSEPIDGLDADHVKRLVEEELTKEDIEVKTPNGNASAPVYVSRPMEDWASKGAFDPKSDSALNLYKSALILRPVDPHWSIKLQREGDIDDDEVWRWAADDWRVFEEKKIPHDPKARIGLLVDISGSMHGSKLNSAVQIARLFVEALTSIHGVIPYVWAHTGDINEQGSNVYRIWEPGDPMTRLGLLHSLDHGNNYDGHAIAYVAKELAGRAMPDEQKLLIVISDGLPSGSLGYGGIEGQQHVRIAVDDAQKAKDIRVLQIAIDTSVDEARQRSMFDEFIPFKPGDSLDVVPKRMTRWLEKAL
jgi:cobalamin biosynthesis protein CobT